MKRNLALAAACLLTNVPFAAQAKDPWPQLMIERGVGLSLSWPTNASDFVVESSSKVTGPWVPFAPGFIGRITWLSGTPPSFSFVGQKFFRLRKPDGVLRPPVVPDSLKVPDGQVLLYHAFVIDGAQIYTCQANPTNASLFAWTFKAPQADLVNDEVTSLINWHFAIHYAGPTWESLNDGSKVVGTVQARSPSPDPEAIPWLLLKAKSNEGSGIFSNVTYIQRVNTSGGNAPVEGCDAAHTGKDVYVDYTAEYFFFGPAQ